MKVASSSILTCSRQRIVSLLSSVEPRSDCEPSRGPPWRFPNARCVWCVFEVHEEVECRPLRAECVFWAIRLRVTAQVNFAPAQMLRQERRGNFFERFWRQNHEKASQRSAHLAWGATGPVGQTARNRLKIGVRREGTVSNQLLETRRLIRTDG